MAHNLNLGRKEFCGVTMETETIIIDTVTFIQPLGENIFSCWCWLLSNGLC